MTARALELLRAAGADSIEHPGGTLLAHLVRVEELLVSWDARPALRAAGLCHAFYGTDGFALSLLDLDRRAELTEAIGAEAEALVYLYASCDRKASYRTLAAVDGLFVDRFTGGAFVLDASRRRDMAELTAANELDLVAHSAEVREKFGQGLLGLFTRWRSLLSEAAWDGCQDLLG